MFMIYSVAICIRWEIRRDEFRLAFCSWEVEALESDPDSDWLEVEIGRYGAARESKSLGLCHCWYGNLIDDLKEPLHMRARPKCGWPAKIPALRHICPKIFRSEFSLQYLTELTLRVHDCVKACSKLFLQIATRKTDIKLVAHSLSGRSRLAWNKWSNAYFI